MESKQCRFKCFLHFEGPVCTVQWPLSKMMSLENKLGNAICQEIKIVIEKTPLERNSIGFYKSSRQSELGIKNSLPDFAFAAGIAGLKISDVSVLMFTESAQQPYIFSCAGPNASASASKSLLDGHFDTERFSTTDVLLLSTGS